MFVVRGIPRGSLVILFSALIVAAAILANGVYTARGSSHDATYYACLYSGSLTQVGTTMPTNCGRGVAIQWGGVAGIDDLGEDVQQALRCGAFPHWTVDWSGCDMHGANLMNAELRLAKLVGTDLSLTDLTDADLFDSDLTGANLTSVWGPDASFVDADLTDAVLSSSHFPNASFTGADLTNATLQLSDVTGADFTGAIFCNTTMPDGSINNSNCP